MDCVFEHRSGFAQGWALALVSIGLVSTAESEPKLKTLSGREVRQELVGNVITDEYHWSYFLKPDGSIDATEMGRPRKGHWHIQGNRLCIVIIAGAAPDQCWDVMRDGKELIFGINGQTILYVKVEKPGS
jgi:hypothetical protein